MKGDRFFQTLKDAEKYNLKWKPPPIIKTYTQYLNEVPYILKVQFEHDKTHFILKLKNEEKTWLKEDISMTTPF
jgi:hypothetical protein